MRVLMKVDLSGTHNGERFPRRGRVADLPEGVAVKMVANGQAVPVADDPVETATVPTVEVEERDESPTALTTENGPVKRRPGRPRKG